MIKYTKAESATAEKMGLSLYLVRALAEDGKVQMRTVCAIALQAHEDTKAGKSADDVCKGLPLRLFAAYPHRSAKTWANYVTGARAVLDKAAAVIASEVSGAESYGEALPGIIVHVAGELTKYRYVHSLDDIARWGKGSVSLSDQAASDKVAADKLAAEKAENDAKQAAQLATEQAARKVETDAAAAADAIKKAEPVPTEVRADAPTTTLPPVAPIVPVPVPVFTVARDHTGKLIFTADATLTRAELVDIGLKIEALHADLMSALTPTAPTIPADIRVETAAA